MTGNDIPRTADPRVDAVGMRIAARCTIVGAIVFGIVRTLHGDTPGAHAAAALEFVANRPQYAAVHIAAVFAALLGLAGLIALAGSLTAPAARMWSWLGLAAALVGLGIFGVESTSEGLALPELAQAIGTAPAEQRPEIVAAAHAVLAATHGPSLVAVSLLYGAAPLATGIAILHDTYPAALGWAGTAIGALTLGAAAGQYLNPDLIPGFLIYGVLASVIVQLWLIGVAVVLLRASRSGSDIN